MMKKRLLLLTLCIVLLCNGCAYHRYTYADDYNTRKIEVYDLLAEGELVCTITDKYDIVDYMDNLYSDYGMGIEVSELPEGCEALYRIDYWQNTTKQLLNPDVRMVKTSQDTLYRDEKGNYYIYTEIEDAYMPVIAREYSISVSHIPEEVAEGLISMIQYY